jgi:anti-sigma factor RsiW
MLWIQPYSESLQAKIIFIQEVVNKMAARVFLIVGEKSPGFFRMRNRTVIFGEKTSLKQPERQVDAMNNHHEDPVQILRYVQGDLNDQELATFSRHLRECSECQSHVEEEKTLSRMLQKASPLYTAPAELHARVTASLRERSGLRAKLQATAAGIGDEIQKALYWGTQRWLPALCAVFIAFIGLGFSRSMLREIRAREYVEVAVAAHRDTLDGRLPLQIQSDAPETVTRWAGQQVSFHFKLPVPQNVPQGVSRFRIAGARLVEFAKGRGIMVQYHRQEQTVSLLIAPADTVVVAGGDKVQDGRLLFHYRNHAGFNVITWNNHGLAYALVSSVSGPVRQSCLVCHGSLPAH